MSRVSSCVCVGEAGVYNLQTHPTHPPSKDRPIDRPTITKTRARRDRPIDRPPTQATHPPTQHQTRLFHAHLTYPTKTRPHTYVRRPGGCWCALSPPRSSRAPWTSWRRWGRCRRRRSGPGPRAGGRASPVCVVVEERGVFSVHVSRQTDRRVGGSTAAQGTARSTGRKRKKEKKKKTRKKEKKKKKTKKKKKRARTEK